MPGFVVRRVEGTAIQACLRAQRVCHGAVADRHVVQIGIGANSPYETKSCFGHQKPR
jgi:hypothetical protein